MGKCKRCGKTLDSRRWLFHRVPDRKLGIRYLCGSSVAEFEYAVCVECSREFEKFMEGKATCAVERGCRSCGSMNVEDGFNYCPHCGAKVVKI